MENNLVTIEKRHQELLWVITIVEQSNAGVDAWEAAVRAYIRFVHHDPKRYLIYDTTRIPNLGFTNYMRERATVLAKDNTDATGRVALVAHLPPTVTNLFDFFIRYNTRHMQPNLDVRLFHNREKAIAWVEEALLK